MNSFIVNLHQVSKKVRIICLKCGYKVDILKIPGQVAQLVEQRTENPCVGGSIPSLTTKYPKSLKNLTLSDFLFSMHRTRFDSLSITFVHLRIPFLLHQLGNCSIE